MLPSIPCHVLAPVVGRDNARRTQRSRKPTVPALWNDKASILYASVLGSRAGEAKAGGSDQVGPPDGVPAGCEPLGVVQPYRCGRITRKLRHAVRVFILKISAPKQSVAGTYCVIEAPCIEVISGFLRRRKTKTLDVQPVADREVVGQRIGLHVLQEGGVDSNPSRIDSGLEILGSQTGDGTRGRSVLNNSLAHFGRGHLPQRAGPTPIPAALIVQEIEQPVLSDRAARRRAEHVHQKRRARNAGLVIEE